MFYIVDSFDAPQALNVAVLRDDGLLYYVMPFGGGSPHHRRGMSTERATPVEAFGFQVAPANNGTFLFRKVRASKATYPDGKPRKWQGAEEFIINPTR